jgi:hypothetical protein
MSNNRYLEIDSAYRNRNQWPLAGEFEIPIAQSGSNNSQNALDPVCLSAPIISWTSNNLDKSGKISISGDIPHGPAPASISYATGPSDVVISTAAGNMQQLDNYYTGLILEIYDSLKANTKYRRITGFKYLSTDIAFDYGFLTLETPFNDAYTTLPGTFKIFDFTDLSDTNNPYFFVPGGSYQANAYANTILYNEKYRQYRNVKYYDSITHGLLLVTDTSAVSTDTSGPIPGTWASTDNYTIRKEPPFIPQLASAAYPVTIAPTNKSVITLNIVLNIPINADIGNKTIIPPTTIPVNIDFFKNYGIRIVPNPATPVRYNYNIAAPVNNSTIISSSLYNPATNILTLNLYPPFEVDPGIGASVELLPFSYDSFNPFVYTGSLVSQQEMVCYEIELLNLVLPNQILTCGRGGRIAFYPYVYVELSNVSASGSGVKNIIYSNNPNATTATFRAPIDDIQNPQLSTFIKIDGNGMVQTIKFKPNDNLFFRVILPTGEIYTTINIETKSPFRPNELAQISAIFSLRRL